MDDSPIRVLKPVVVPAQYFVWGLPAAAFLSIFPGFFVFVTSNMIHGGFRPITGYGIIAYVVAFVVCMVLLYVKFFLEPAWITYAIYSDRLEYDEGFWNKHRRTLVFDQVIDVELVEGVLQQSRHAGTVTLVTQQLVSQGEGKLSNRKIALFNIPQPKETYDLIRKLALNKGEVRPTSGS